MTVRGVASMASGREFESILNGLASCREAAVSASDDVLVYFIDMAISQAEQVWVERSTSPSKTGAEERDLATLSGARPH